MSPLDIALEYIGRGWAVVPVPFKSKRPAGGAWQNLRITEADARQWFNGEAQNVGVLLGEASGGLADIDLDCIEAVRVAPYFLPRTLCFGRTSKQRSHWLYQSDLWQTENKAAIQFKFATGRGKDRKEQMILELRTGGGGKAAQTIFPGSVHETGELIAWGEKEPLARADEAALKQCCARAASAALLACHFPSKGARHDAGLTLGGFLSRCGFSRPDTELFAEAVTIASGQSMEKVKDVRKAAGEAWDEGNRPGGKSRGFPTLAETFGDDVARHVARWLGISCGSERNPPHEAKAPGWNPGATEQWTELGNAHRLVRHHGEDVRYVHPMEAWFIWDGVFWRRDDSGDIMRRAEATVEAIFDEARQIPDEEIRTAFRKFALKSQARAQLSNMTQLAQHNLRVVLSPGALDADPMLLGVLNGTIDLNTVTFREGHREDYITKQCAVAFDRTAQCPNWIEFQKKIAGANADLVAYKQRVFGLLLTGEMVEILFILHGDGSNGKTTELETIQGMLGDYAHAVDAKLMLSPNDRSGATPEIVALKGKRAIFINESGDSDHLNESRVKYLCGNDTMSGRDLFEKPINFRPTHKTLLRTNYKPKIRGTDLGIWRRIHYWPYLVTIHDDEKVVKFRETKLDPERAGILNWMLAGLKDYLAGGLKPPPVVCKATKEYRQEMDVTGQWIGAMCERSTIGAKLRLSTLYKSYSKWALDEVGGAVSRQKLAEALREHGFESVLSQGVTVFKNIRLNDEEAEPY
jgi:putative DNA primase/helicase